MGLVEALNVAVGLKDGRNQATVTGPRSCFQIVAFMSLLSMVCVCPVQLNEIQYLVWQM